MNLFGLWFWFMLLGLQIIVGILVWWNSLFLVLKVMVEKFVELLSRLISFVVWLLFVVSRLGQVDSGVKWILVFCFIVCICGSSLFLVQLWSFLVICCGLFVGSVWILKLKWYLVGMMFSVWLFWISLVCIVEQGGLKCWLWCFGVVRCVLILLR